MANPSVGNVLSAKPLVTGGVLVAPLGSAAPTDAVTALDPAFVGAGYVGEDGLTEATERSTDKIKAWGGDIIKVVQTDFSVTYSWAFAEALNSDALKVVYGADNVSTTAATASTGTLHSVKISSETLPHSSFVFDMRDGDARVRIYVPDGQITEVGEITYQDSGIILYQVTMEAFKDSAGFQAYKYLDDGVFSA